MVEMKKWRGKGKFFCPGMKEHNGKIRSIREVEAEDAERAKPLIQAGVLADLGLPFEIYKDFVTVSEVGPDDGLHKAPKKTKPRQTPPKKLGDKSFLDL